MSYNISKFPPDVSRLFKPRPPLQYKAPVDYPLEKRKTNPHISGVSGLLGSTLTAYLKEFSQPSENEYLKKYEEAANAKYNEWCSLETKLQNWDPHNDPNIKDTDPYRTIFVARLPYDVSEMELQKQFGKFGDIERVRVVRDKTTNISKGYAFVAFTDPQSSKSACKEFGLHRGIEIKGRTCIVDIERGRTVKYFKPRRLGGGLGGRGYMKKEKMARFSSTSPTVSGDKGYRRNDVERYRPQSSRGQLPRPAYTGPSRFARSSAVPPVTAPVRYSGSSNELSTSRGQNIPIIANSPVKSSYRSRTARAQETSKTNKPEEPDY